MGTAAGTVAAGDDARFGNALKIQGNNVKSETCADGQVLKWVSANTQFECMADANAGGDITDVVAGTGLSGGAASGSADFSHCGCGFSRPRVLGVHLRKRLAGEAIHRAGNAARSGCLNAG